MTSTPAPQRLQLGALVHNGAYRILRPLNKGGMGMIYLAEDKEAFDRRCVIKEMLDYFDPSDPQEVQEARKRFEDEARTLVSLKHPRIPNLLSYFSEQGHNYIVMEYVEGDTLEQFIGQPQLAPQVIGCGIQVCEILEYLAGLPSPLVHHDIKPANIIVDHDKIRSAWLVDFGVAKARLAVQRNGQVGVKKSSIFGTAGYAPPEQYQAQSEPKSDVYALAATLYHVLTGDDPGPHPFSFPQLPMLPTGVSSALDKALAQDVRQRYTAAELRQALNKASRSLAPPRPPRPPTQHTSYALMVSQPITDADRPAMIRYLQNELGFSVLDAEVLTWQAPARYIRGVNRAQAQVIGSKLKALGAIGVNVSTSQLHSWRQRLSPDEQKMLASRGEVTLFDKRYPQDQICHCHHCGHEWKTQARGQSTLPEACPRCSQQWYPQRIFRCALCGHEFVSSDLTTSAQRLHPACPACKSTAWRPDQQMHFTQSEYTLRLGPNAAGVRLAQTLQLAVTPGALVRGRAVSSANWLVISPTLQANQLSFAVDTHGLAERRIHTAAITIIANAGVARATVEVYIVAPPLLVVRPAALDFGIVKANETRTVWLELLNHGEQTLSGQIACAETWLIPDKQSFAGNQNQITCTVHGDRLPKAGMNVATVRIASTGGHAAVQVRAEALPTMLRMKPASLNVGRQRRRQIPMQLVIENVGVGQLEGTIQSSVPWLLIQDSSIHANYAELSVLVDTRVLQPGQNYTGSVQVSTSGGAIEVPVSVEIAPRGLLARSIALGGLAKWLMLAIFLMTAWITWRFWNDVLSLSSATPSLAPAAARTLSPTSIAEPTTIVTVQPLEVTRPTISAPLLPAAQPPTLTPDQPSLPLAAADEETAVAGETDSSTILLEELRRRLAQIPTPTAETSTATATSPSAPATATPGIPTQPAVELCIDPRAVITAPAAGQTLRGAVSIYGVARHEAFRYYKIEIAPAASSDERFSFITDSDTPVAAGLLATMDTTMFRNGKYLLQLTVVDRSGNYPSPCRVAVIIDN
ncbi:MAG: protein kinase [Caldilineaceae bacterium]|nr:protein kinase [Caldilineaceae bacterium]